MSNMIHHPCISQVVLLIEEGGPEVVTPSLQVTERCWLFDPETFDIHEIPPPHDGFINAAFQKQGGIEIDELTIGSMDDDSGAVIRDIHSPRATRAGAPRVTPKQIVNWDEFQANIKPKLSKGELCIDEDGQEHDPGWIFNAHHCNTCVCWGNKLWCEHWKLCPEDDPNWHWSDNVWDAIVKDMY